MMVAITHAISNGAIIVLSIILPFAQAPAETDQQPEVNNAMMGIQRLNLVHMAQHGPIPFAMRAVYLCHVQPIIVEMEFAI